MKILQQIVTASTLFIGSSLFAQDAKPTTAPATAPTAAGQAAPTEDDIANAPIDEAQMAAMFPKSPMNAESFDAAAKSPEAIAKGVAMLDQVAAAYKAAPAMTDTVVYTMKILGGEQKESFAISMGAGQDMQVKVATMNLTCVNGSVYFADESMADKFVQVPLDGTLLNTLKEKFQGMEFPVPHLALRSAAPGKAVDSFGFGGSSFEKVSGYQEKDGSAQILLDGGESDMMLTVNPTTKLLSAM